jgi:hypothetical protein
MIFVFRLLVQPGYGHFHLGAATSCGKRAKAAAGGDQQDTRIARDGQDCPAFSTGTRDVESFPCRSGPDWA